LPAIVPDGFQSSLIPVDDVTIHVVHNGGSPNVDGTIDAKWKPALLMLHGFPEYWAAWKPLIPYLSEHFLMIMPDQRGYNLSSKPQELEAYQASKLSKDMIGLMDRLLPGQAFTLAGHDWGAAVAYALAIGNPELVEKLVIINGVHPVTFQRALSNDPAQAKASQYMLRLRADDAEQLMSANGFEKTFGMLEKLSATKWLTKEEREGYLNAWSQPGAMNAMLNWYRASPLVVPTEDDPDPEAWLLDVDPAKFVIAMPHLVIWGMDDPALLPVCRAGLYQFAPDLRVVEVPNADHWIIHLKPEQVADEMKGFLFN
jgi:epoxide hydrolase 4